ncbi:MAG TPA: kelch repeat-containing protein [Bryobacterales bacterium]|nr:kelch repeat-containing protein [Bryobacterales bacterium]
MEIARDSPGASSASAIRYAEDARAFFLGSFSFDPDARRWDSQTGGTPSRDMAFDQVAYDPAIHSLLYFAGGATLAYDVVARRWRDLAPSHSPPPVAGGSLAYDPVSDQIVLFGGGHVAERAPDGRVVGYTGTWLYDPSGNEWRPWPLLVSPPPRTSTRMVCDARNQVLVLFGGDGENQYLADTWLFDLKTRSWRSSKAKNAPEARAGHFTVYDPETGWVIVGGGYNRKDLADMWAYDAAQDRWRKLAGVVPRGFHLSADIAPEKRLLVLVASGRKPGEPGVTYGYRIEKGAVESAEAPPAARPILKQPASAPAGLSRPVAVSFPNQWVKLGGGEEVGPARAQGLVTLDSSRGLLLYWGGACCAYQGNDVDAYDIAAQAWRSNGAGAEYPERLGDASAGLQGVTFRGAPWAGPGGGSSAYDPVGRTMILVRPIRLPAGYEPEALDLFPVRRAGTEDTRYATWSYDPETARWELLGGAPAGVDTLVTTPHGVMAVNPEGRDTAVYLLDAVRKQWRRLSDSGPSPQNLSERAALAYDSARDRLILHGGGAKRDELWTFEVAARRWQKLQPAGAAPAPTRQAVFIPREDAFLLYGPAPDDLNRSYLWAYHVLENVWRRVEVAPPPGMAGSESRTMVYDGTRDLVLLVLGPGGGAGSDLSQASVCAMRYRHTGARSQ